MEQPKKIRFPFGILFFIFFILTIATNSGAGYYFYKSLKNEINQIITNTRDHAFPLAEAYGQVASTKDKKSKLSKFFKNSIKKNLFYKAFYVKSDGKIIVHSSKKEAKSLRYNIATDEFAYNLDQIMSPLREKSNKVYFLDYNLMDKSIPFNHQEIKYIKKYIYKDIDRNGWLVTKGVKKGRKFIGTVNFLISKNSIYDLILTKIKFLIKLSIIITAGSFILSLIFSIIIFRRYKSIERKSMQSHREEIPVITSATEKKIKIEIPVKTDEKVTDEKRIEIFEEDQGSIEQPIIVPDAIPVERKGKS